MRKASFECAGCTAKNSLSINPDEGDYQQTVVPCSNCGRDNIIEISIDPETKKISIVAETE
jgi:transcription elongation factor Elf1